jgi:hypothetical protein
MLTTLINAYFFVSSAVLMRLESTSLSFGYQTIANNPRIDRVSNRTEFAIGKTLIK